MYIKRKEKIALAEQGLGLCCTCKKIKASEEFTRDKKKTFGISSQCKKCKEIQSKKYRASIVQLQHRENGKIIYTGIMCKADIYKKYGNVCMICSCKENLIVDHCHKTNIVRGVLCESCNKGLGFFRDCKDRLNKAITYLD